MKDDYNYLNNMTSRDAFDLSLLNNQAIGILIIIYGNILSFNSTMQSMDLIKKRYTDSITYTPDPDIPALLGTQYSLFSQLILTKITSTQFNESMMDFYNSGDPTKIQTNTELYVANILYSLGYSLSLIGVQKIYNTNHTGPIIGI